MLTPTIKSPQARIAKIITKIKYNPKEQNLVLSSDSSQITISHISNEIWQYKIGSYEVIHKWLKQRKKDKVKLTLHSRITSCLPYFITVT